MKAARDVEVDARVYYNDTENFCDVRLSHISFKALSPLKFIRTRCVKEWCISLRTK